MVGDAGQLHRVVSPTIAKSMDVLVVCAEPGLLRYRALHLC